MKLDVVEQSIWKFVIVLLEFALIAVGVGVAVKYFAQIHTVFCILIGAAVFFGIWMLFLRFRVTHIILVVLFSLLWGAVILMSCLKSWHLDTIWTVFLTVLAVAFSGYVHWTCLDDDYNYTGISIRH